MHSLRSIYGKNEQTFSHHCVLKIHGKRVNKQRSSSLSLLFLAIDSQLCVYWVDEHFCKSFNRDPPCFIIGMVKALNPFLSSFIWRVIGYLVLSCPKRWEWKDNSQHVISTLQIWVGNTSILRLQSNSRLIIASPAQYRVHSLQANISLL